MTTNPNSPKKAYRLEQRAKDFAIDVRKFLKLLPRNVSVSEDGKQLVRSSGSIGANYIEAQESFSRKDCLFRLKIAKKEARESVYWLSILADSSTNDVQNMRVALEKEATELASILSSMIQKAQKHEW